MKHVGCAHRSNWEPNNNNKLFLDNRENEKYRNHIQESISGPLACDLVSWFFPKIPEYSILNILLSITMPLIYFYLVDDCPGCF